MEEEVYSEKERRWWELRSCLYFLMSGLLQVITASVGSFLCAVFTWHQPKRCNALIWKYSVISLKPHGRPDTTDTIPCGVTAAIYATSQTWHRPHSRCGCRSEGEGLAPGPRDASVGRLSGVETRETGESCSSLILTRGWNVAVEANMNSQGAISILFYFYHLFLKIQSCNIKNLNVTHAFSPRMDQFRAF